MDWREERQQQPQATWAVQRTRYDKDRVLLPLLLGPMNLQPVAILHTYSSSRYGQAPRAVPLCFSNGLFCVVVC
jgi:hypothetical protein